MTRVLVIDDETQMGIFFHRLLKRKNIEVVASASGKEARQILCEQQFQVALVDLCLPDTDGLRMLQEIKSMQPECEVIIVTCSSDTRTAVKAIKLGAYDYLVKPFDNIVELERSIKEAVLVSLNKEKITDSIDPVNQFRKLKSYSWEKVPPEQLLLSYRLTKELEKRLSRTLNEQKLSCEKPVTLKDMEKRAIANALAFYDHNVTLVARALGIGRTTLYRKMKEYGIANLSQESVKAFA